MPRRRGSGAQGRRGKGKWSMDYTLVKQVRDNAPLRESFFALARRVFGLSFEEWHRAGWWTDRYVPYTMVYRDGSAAANVSVNRIDTVWRGEALRLVQLGTVMTAPEHRGKGLARSLMEAVLDDWGRTCDGVYLYAYGTVLEFYPKFGFVPAREHVCTLPLPARDAAPAEGGFARLDMDTQAGRALLLRCYERSNPFSALPMLDNPGLLMFYCSGFLKDCVYYSSAYDLACVATEEDGVFTCCDFFGSVRRCLCRFARRDAGRTGLHARKRRRIRPRARAGRRPFVRAGGRSEYFCGRPRDAAAAFPCLNAAPQNAREERRRLNASAT